MNDACKPFRDRLADAVFGDEDPAARNTLEAHLATCTDCRAEKRLLLETERRLRDAGDAPVPRHFFVHPETGASRRRLARAAVAAVVLVALAWVGLAVARPHVRVEQGVLMVSLGEPPGPKLLQPLDESIQALEARLDRRMTEQAAALWSELNRVETGLYQAVSLQRAQDLIAFQDQLELAAARHEIQERRTDALSSVVLQVIDSRETWRRTP